MTANSYADFSDTLPITNLNYEPLLGSRVKKWKQDKAAYLSVVLLHSILTYQLSNVSAESFFYFLILTGFSSVIFFSAVLSTVNYSTLPKSKSEQNEHFETLISII